uniref:Uroporphyrinogen-III synthase n=1 Tax=Megaselia scalaris TaxID=36166 RepID=T1H6K5_MEGSC
TVILLKSETESSDVYGRLLEANNFKAIFVPTLGFGFKKLDELKKKLEHPEKYAGIIFTSPRSVDAVRGALGEDPNARMLCNYSVGEVTHNLVMSTLNQLFTKGKETGNANNLSEFIKDGFDGNKSLPFLFPCGNLRTDTLITKLSECGFQLDAFEVYETICHPDLGENLKKALEEENVEFMAFFSPSGVNCTYEYFQKNNLSFNGKKLIAIGPSTRKCIEGKGLEVYSVAEKPTVDYLIKVLINPN